MDILKEQINSEYLLKYVALHRMMLLMYQHCHWATKGTSYYADHLLYERIYAKISEEIDKVAEKAVGLSSESSVCPIKTTDMSLKLLHSILPNFNISEDPHRIVECLLEMEVSFLDQNESLYSKLESENQLTLGMDDLISSIHSSHEENVYLLKQRYKVMDITIKEHQFEKEELQDEKESEENDED